MEGQPMAVQCNENNSAAPDGPRTPRTRPPSTRSSGSARRTSRAPRSASASARRPCPATRTPPASPARRRRPSPGCQAAPPTRIAAGKRKSYRVGPKVSSWPNILKFCKSLLTVSGWPNFWDNPVTFAHGATVGSAVISTPLIIFHS